jgi:acyl phosphate:glycerol-3-phosphate acyltransferase
MTLALWLAASYLLGAIPASLIAARLGKGVDLRRVGSGNLGATNLYRVMGWRYAIPVGLFDVAKGAVPVAVFGPRAGEGPAVALLCGLVAVVGHVYSVFVRFRGGKGVATGAGAVLALAPWAFLAGAAVWVVALRLSGYVSLASILAAASLPPAAWLLHPAQRELVGLLAALAVFVIALHHANIRRLLAGTENRFGRRPPPPEGAA